MIYHDIMDHALRAQVQWIESQMRLLDPRELCHVSLVLFAGRPMYCELHCRGRFISSFEIKQASV